MDQGHGNARPGTSQGVAQGNRAPVYVDNGIGQAKQFDIGQPHHAEGFIELKKVDVFQFHARLVKGQGQGLGGGGGKPFGFLGRVGIAADAGQGLQLQLGGLFGAHEHQGSSPVVDGGGIGGGYGAVFGKGGPQGRDLVEDHVFIFLVLADQKGFPPALRHFHRHDLGAEGPVFPGLGRPLVRLNGIVVLLFPAEAVFGGTGIGADPHGLLIVHIDQAVALHPVFEGGRAEFLAGAHVHVVGDEAHVFHAAGNHDGLIAQGNALGRLHDGFHARGAYLVDRGAGHRIWKAGVQGRLPGRGLSGSRLHYMPHEHFIDQARVEPDPVQGAFDGSGSQFRGRNGGEGPHETAYWRPHGRYDYDLFHFRKILRAKNTN